MHIDEGVLSNSPEGIIVLSAGAVVAAAGTAWALRKMDYERVPRVAMLSSAFFVVSLIHVPLPLVPTPVHLVLNGLIGLMLGWAAFPALLIALFLQAILFGYGGLTALGINTTTMALPALVCYYLFRRPVASRSDSVAYTAAFAAGALGVLLAALLTASALWATGKEFRLFAGAVIVFHLAVAAIEGLVTGSVVLFLRKVRPELLKVPLLAPAR